MAESVTQNNFQVEMVTIEQFAAKMSVSRTTIYDWIKSGHLLPGRHFIKIGSIIRFCWGPDLFQRLLDDSVETKAVPIDQPLEIPIHIKCMTPVTREKGLHINLDY